MGSQPLREFFRLYEQTWIGLGLENILMFNVRGFAVLFSNFPICSWGSLLNNTGGLQILHFLDLLKNRPGRKRKDHLTMIELCA